MNWKIQYLPEAEKDLQNLDGSSRFREYERDFLQRKIEILSDRVKDMDRDDYDER